HGVTGEEAFAVEEDELGAAEPPTLVSFRGWTEARARESLRMWPGRKICAIDWSSPDAATQLEWFVEAQVDWILSERFPDEVPSLANSVRDYFEQHWTWLPPAVRLPATPPGAQRT